MSRRRRASRCRRALLLALLPLAAVANAATLYLWALRVGSGARGGGHGAGRGRVRVSARQGASGEPGPSAAMYGVQQEPGDAVDPSVYGDTGQTAEAIETGIRGQGGGPRLKEANAIVFPSQSSREGGVYVLDFSERGPGGGPICKANEGDVCEVAPDLFSRSGLVLRESVDEQVGVNRKGVSLETQHTCVCLDSACRHIAEMRVVDVYETEADLIARNPREHGCVLRRRKGGEGRFTGCAQSLLVASSRGQAELKEHIISSNFTLGRKSASKFPPTIATWDFLFQRSELRWSAHGYRGYVNVMMAEEFDALRREDLERNGLEVEFGIVAQPFTEGETELVTHSNTTAGQLCAETANWALHAAEHQATALDDAGRGVVDSTFVEPLPPRASSTELALSIGQALLGLATLYLLLGEVLLEMSKLQDGQRQVGGGVALPTTHARRRRWRRLQAVICKWPVGLAWLGGLMLLGLEMIAIGVVWVGERKAAHTLGRFMHASFVAAIARSTGPTPFLIDERGNVVVVNVIVGTARYTSSNERPLRIVFPVCLALGASAVLLAMLPVLVWRRFSSHELNKSRAAAADAAAAAATATPPPGSAPPAQDTEASDSVARAKRAANEPPVTVGKRPSSEAPPASDSSALARG